jgi:proline iminopeptidase
VWLSGVATKPTCPRVAVPVHREGPRPSFSRDELHLRAFPSGGLWTFQDDAAPYDADMIIGLEDGRVAEFDLVGEGAPLLWFEGGPGLNASLGRTDVEALPAGRFAGYLIEPPGSGRSTPPPDPQGYGFRQQARFYEDVRQALGLGPVTVFGHSWGGSVALAFAALFPEATTGCIAMDAFAGPAADDSDVGMSEFQANTSRFAARPWFTAAMRAFQTPAAQLPDDPVQAGACWAPMWPLYFADPDRADVQVHISRLREEVRVNVRAHRAADDWAFAEVDLEPLLPRIACPTLLLAGRYDFVCGPSHARFIGDRLPGASLVVIEDAGHIPSWESPGRFRDAVQSWLAESGAD